MARKYILVTGANGFIGKRLCQVLSTSGFSVRAIVRKSGLEHIHEYDSICLGDIGDVGHDSDWREIFLNVDTVIHLAGMAHVVDDIEDNSLAVFRKVNVFGTERLARMAARAGVKRFIFLSSIKVNGEGVLRPYTEDNIPEPKDAYGISKWEAEAALSRIACETKLEMVILRSPLVYGPGVKANFKSLIKITDSGLPLPFKGISNRRSFVYLDNLVNGIITCIKHPDAAGETFMISDGQDVSTPNIIKLIAFELNKKPVLFTLHASILKFLCGIIGKGEEIEKLTGTLIVDSSKIRRMLGWEPSFRLEEGIKETVKYYIDEGGRFFLEQILTRLKQILTRLKLQQKRMRFNLVKICSKNSPPRGPLI